MAGRTKNYIIWTLTITYQSIENRKQQASSFVVEGVTCVSGHGRCKMNPLLKIKMYRNKYQFFLNYPVLVFLSLQ